MPLYPPINTISILKDILEPTGFCLDKITGEINTNSSELSFDNETRTFTIATKEPYEKFEFYQSGTKYIKRQSESVEITDIEGLHYIYFDSGVLSHTNSFTLDLLYSKVYVCAIYWDATNNIAIYVGNERHGFMEGRTHVNLHLSRGTIYVNDCALNTLSFGDGSLNTHAQFGLNSGEIRDEDIKISLFAILSTVGCPVFYRDGENGYWRRQINNGFSVLTTGTGKLAYNQLNGGSWELTEITNNNCVLYHIFATNDINYPYFSIMGQDDYGNANSARMGANIEINNLVLNGLPTVEFVPVASVIYQTSDSYENSVKAKIIKTDLGADYVDWRLRKINPSLVLSY